MKFAFIAAREVAFPVQVMCSLLGVSRSGFYAWRRRPVAARRSEDARLAVEIAAAHARGRCAYGSPRVHRELRAQGRRVGKKRVERLMRESGIRARQKRRFRITTDSNHPYPVAPNVLARNFEASAPNQAWVGDVTFIPTAEGWLYLAVLIDVFSRRVVGSSTSRTSSTQSAGMARHVRSRVRAAL